MPQGLLKYERSSSRRKYTNIFRDVLVLIVLALSCAASYAQPSLNNQLNPGRGIEFVEDLSWDEILAKAGMEDKYIFVDLFATWCIPCKKMDRSVYVDPSVGELFNDRFISVKIQTDSTGRDNENVRKWYEQSAILRKKYNVDGYPGFLFFSSDGRLAYKSIGFKSVKEFIELGNEALKPGNLEYYSNLELYKRGELDLQRMETLAFDAYQFGETGLAKSIATEYIGHFLPEHLLTNKRILLINNIIGDRKRAAELARLYKKDCLDKLPAIRLCSRENFAFIQQFPDLVTSADNVFFLCYNNPDKVDSLTESENFSKYLVEKVIAREELDSKLLMGNKPISAYPDWDYHFNALKKKYPRFDAASLVINYPISYYRRIADYDNWVKYQDRKIANTLSSRKLSNEDLFWELNLPAWNVFLKCTGKESLNVALSWSDLSLKLSTEPNIQSLDTRANLLYKLGRTSEAIAQEEEAITQALILCKKEGADIQFIANLMRSFEEVIVEMKKGMPTYLKDGAVWNTSR